MGYPTGHHALVSSQEQQCPEERCVELLYLDLVSESSRSEPPGNGSGPGVRGKLKNRSLSVGTATDDKNLTGVLDGHYGAGRQKELLPGATQVDDVHTSAWVNSTIAVSDWKVNSEEIVEYEGATTIDTSFVDILLHLVVDIIGAQMGTGSQHFRDVVLFEGQRLVTS